jgi:diguanylate cyclase (GGDEF)-like protein
LLLALAIGYAAAVYHGAMQRRMRELYDSSIRDSLTGMFNRRGAMDLMKKAVDRHAGRSAMLVVDIDNLKLINDMRGHTTGDAVLRGPPRRFAQASRKVTHARGLAMSS